MDNGLSYQGEPITVEEIVGANMNDFVDGVVSFEAALENIDDTLGEAGATAVQHGEARLLALKIRRELRREVAADRVEVERVNHGDHAAAQAVRCDREAGRLRAAGYGEMTPPVQALREHELIWIHVLAYHAFYNCTARVSK